MTGYLPWCCTEPGFKLLRASSTWSYSFTFLHILNKLLFPAFLLNRWILASFSTGIRYGSCTGALKPATFNLKTLKYDVILVHVSWWMYLLHDIAEVSNRTFCSSNDFPWLKDHLKRRMRKNSRFVVGTVHVRTYRLEERCYRHRSPRTLPSAPFSSPPPHSESASFYSECANFLIPPLPSWTVSGAVLHVMACPRPKWIITQLNKTVQ